MITATFNNGEVSGQGKIEFADKRVYTGLVKKDKANGEGEMTWPGQDEDEPDKQYKGSFKNNKRHGKGFMTWPDGQTFEGTYKNDEISGPGIKQLLDKTRV